MVLCWCTHAKIVLIFPLFSATVLGNIESIVKGSMTKKQLIGIVAKRAHMPKRAAEEAVEVFLEEIGRTLQKGGKVVLSGFGTFTLGKVKEKQVVPFGQEQKRMVIKGHKVVNFKPGKPLKKAVW